MCVCSQRRSLGLFEVLARNRQSAVELLGRTRRALLTNNPNVYNTSSTTTVLSHLVGDTNTERYTTPRTKKYTSSLLRFLFTVRRFFFKLHTISHEKKSRHPYAQKGALLMLLRKASLAKMRALTSLECSTSSVCSR